LNVETARRLYPEAKQLAGLASEEWLESYNLEKQRAEICMRDDQTGEIIPIAELMPSCPYDDRVLMMKSPTLVRALLVLLNQSFAEIRRLQPKADKKKDYAAECAMKCQNDGLFKRYLMEAHQLQDAGDAERVKTRVRSILNVTSMGDLNKDPAAAARWQSLRGDFDAWRRGI
jgi:hypothetical protein